MDNGYAMITGATGGLGKAFAQILLRQGYSLLLTGRSEEKLCLLKEELQAKNEKADIRVYAADLSNLDSRNELFAKIGKEEMRISVLVNAAGADIQKEFRLYSQEKIAFQCRVNFEAAVSVCRFVLDNAEKDLRIVNVASVSGIYPMPYFAIYSASKKALTSFSLALREEVKSKGVKVTAVLPGAMPTREDIKAQIKGQGVWGKLAAKTPEWVAEYSLKAVERNRRQVIPGFWNQCMRFFTAWLPLSWKLRFIAKRWSKISKDAF